MTKSQERRDRWTAVVIAAGLLLALGWNRIDVAPAVAAPPPAGNQPPEIVTLSVVPGDRSQAVAALVSAVDPEDDPIELEIRWLVGDEVVAYGPALRLGSRELPPAVSLEVVARDPHAASPPERRRVALGHRPGSG